MNTPIECSIIIPAYNESNVIVRCLENLLQGLDFARCEVIVVANGCKDDTCVKAQQFSQVKVVDIEEASKIAALNTGDKLANGVSRAYIDADILLSGTALMQVLDYLNTHDEINVAAPKIKFDLSYSNILVKAFYSMWQALPYLKDSGLVGSGVFVLSKKGRASFDLFPSLISDDGYVRTLFAKKQRAAVEGCSFTVFAPRKLSDIIRIKTRVRLGNLELKKKFPSANIGGENTSFSAVKVLAKKPWLLPSAFIYFCAQYLTKRAANARLARNDLLQWDRDNSSRSADNTSLS